MMGHSVCLFLLNKMLFLFLEEQVRQLPQGPEQVYGLAGQLPFSPDKMRTLLEYHFSIHEMEKIIPLLRLSSTRNTSRMEKHVVMSRTRKRKAAPSSSH